MGDIDQALEAGYNARAARDDYDSVLNDWVARSEAARAAAGGFRELRYGANERQQLDVFPVGDGGPTLVYLHGGYWQRGDKSVYSFLAEPFNRRGVSIVVMGYTLCPAGTVADIVDEIRGGLLWLYRNGGDYGLDPERVNLTGHSAGGHLTAMMLATDWRGYGDDIPADLVRTGIPISGLYDLEPLRHTSINREARIDDTVSRRCSPLHLRPASAAPVLVVVGGAETAAFHEQAGRFADRWSASGARVEQYVEPGADHFDVVNRLAEANGALFEKTLSWIV